MWFFAAGIMCIMASIWFLTDAVNSQQIRKEAIQRGYAEEVYMPNGSKAWRWKE
jgi:hypothetical protein